MGQAGLTREEHAELTAYVEQVLQEIRSKHPITSQQRLADLQALHNAQRQLRTVQAAQIACQYKRLLTKKRAKARQRRRRAYGVGAAASFLGLMIVVGRVEADAVGLLSGGIGMAICIALFGMFIWLAEGKKPPARH